jgi:hypothetical protein
MCYSAQIKADYQRFLRHFKATLSLRDFMRIYWARAEGSKLKIPRALDALFAHPECDEEREIKRLIDEHDARQGVEYEQELFRQRKRLADAERALQTKATKAAAESRRIANAYFSDRGRPFQSDRGPVKRVSSRPRRGGAQAPGRNVAQPSTISLKRPSTRGRTGAGFGVGLIFMF